MLAVALAFSSGGLVAWWDTPGEWPLVVATGVSLVLLWLDVRDDPERPREVRPDAVPEEWWRGGTGASAS